MVHGATFAEEELPRLENFATRLKEDCPSKSNAILKFRGVTPGRAWVGGRHAPPSAHPGGLQGTVTSAYFQVIFGSVTFRTILRNNSPRGITPWGVHPRFQGWNFFFLGGGLLFNALGGQGHFAGTAYKINLSPFAPLSKVGVPFQNSGIYV